MITQSLFHELQKSLIHLATEVNSTNESYQFIRPYVLVIHRPTRCGFYLDRDYRHIIDVKNCQEPEKPAEVTKRHLCMSSNLPAWVKTENTEEFDTFWFY